MGGEVIFILVCYVFPVLQKNRLLFLPEDVMVEDYTSESNQKLVWVGETYDDVISRSLWAVVEVR